MIKIAKKRLLIEWNDWIRNPLPNFILELGKDAKGNPNYFEWICYLPGRKGGLWESVRHKLIMSFDVDYPAVPPSCVFKVPLFHPNIYPSGTVCLSILNCDEDWMPSIKIKQVLIGIQDLLDNANVASPAQIKPFTTYKKDYNEYVTLVREQVEQIKQAALNTSECCKVICNCCSSTNTNDGNNNAKNSPLNASSTAPSQTTGKISTDTSSKKRLAKEALTDHPNAESQSGSIEDNARKYVKTDNNGNSDAKEDGEINVSKELT